MSHVFALHSRPRFALAAALAAAALACGCAPDALNNRRATGFDGFIDTLARNCKPLIIGNQDVGQMIQFNDLGNTNYNYFLDVASKLYYNRIGSDDFQQAVASFFGDGSYNAASFACIGTNLPANRPNAPQ